MHHLKSKPKPLLVNSCLILAQIIFGLGTVIAALGLPACYPFSFALYRELCAGFLLLCAAAFWSSSSPGQQEQPTSLFFKPILESPFRFALLGLTIYGNQAGFIVGIKLAGGVAAAVWQPSQPIMTAAISMALKREPMNRWRICGVGIAFCGCATMVALSTAASNKSSSDGENDSSNFLMGNVLFFLNCLSTSLFVILSKEVLKLYPPLLVTAWSYSLAAAYMAPTAFLTSLSPRIMNTICPECTSPWEIPPGAWFALAYFIVFSSVISYGLLTWANQFATGTLVMGFTVLQPVVAALLTLLLLGLSFVKTCDAASNNGGACLDPPGWSSAIGMFGVFCGLYLVITTEPSPQKEDERYEQVSQNDGEAPSSGNQTTSKGA